MGHKRALRSSSTGQISMQFHLSGFEPGDPEIADPAERVHSSGAAGPVPAEVDVLIIGCGPAGLNLAAQLSVFPDIKTCIVEQKEGRLLLGQADGIACRRKRSKTKQKPR